MEHIRTMYFPPDIPEEDTDEIREMRHENTPYHDVDEDHIYKEEVGDIVKPLKKRKATSTYKIPNKAIRAIFKVIG